MKHARHLQRQHGTTSAVLHLLLASQRARFSGVCWDASSSAGRPESTTTGQNERTGQEECRPTATARRVATTAASSTGEGEEQLVGMSEAEEARLGVTTSCGCVLVFGIVRLRREELRKEEKNSPNLHSKLLYVLDPRRLGPEVEPDPSFLHVGPDGTCLRFVGGNRFLTTYDSRLLLWDFPCGGGSLPLPVFGSSANLWCISERFQSHVTSLACFMACGRHNNIGGTTLGFHNNSALSQTRNESGVEAVIGLASGQVWLVRMESSAVDARRVLLWTPELGAGYDPSDDRCKKVIPSKVIPGIEGVKSAGKNFLQKKFFGESAPQGRVGAVQQVTCAGADCLAFATGDQLLVLARRASSSSKNAEHWSPVLRYLHGARITSLSVDVVFSSTSSLREDSSSTVVLQEYFYRVLTSDANGLVSVWALPRSAGHSSHVGGGSSLGPSRSCGAEEGSSACLSLRGGDEDLSSEELLPEELLPEFEIYRWSNKPAAVFLAGPPPADSSIKGDPYPFYRPTLDAVTPCVGLALSPGKRLFASLTSLTSELVLHYRRFYNTKQEHHEVWLAVAPPVCFENPFSSAESTTENRGKKSSSEKAMGGLAEKAFGVTTDLQEVVSLDEEAFREAVESMMPEEREKSLPTEESTASLRSKNNTHKVARREVHSEKYSEAILRNTESGSKITLSDAAAVLPLLRFQSAEFGFCLHRDLFRTGHNKVSLAGSPWFAALVAACRGAAAAARTAAPTGKKFSADEYRRKFGARGSALLTRRLQLGNAAYSCIVERCRNLLLTRSSASSLLECLTEGPEGEPIWFPCFFALVQGDDEAGVLERAGGALKKRKLESRKNIESKPSEKLLPKKAKLPEVRCEPDQSSKGAGDSAKGAGSSSSPLRCPLCFNTDGGVLEGDAFHETYTCMKCGGFFAECQRTGRVLLAGEDACWECVCCGRYSSLLPPPSESAASSWPAAEEFSTELAPLGRCVFCLARAIPV